MDTLVINQLSSAAIVVFLLEWLKKQPWFTWLDENSTNRVKAVFAVIGAAVSVAGITYVWVPESGTLTISGLTFTGIVTALLTWGWAFVQQYVGQKILYKLVKPSTARLPLAAVMIPPPVK